jgi:hypothetical protein
MALEQSLSAAKDQMFGQTLSASDRLRKFADPAVAFSTANIFNFSQAKDPFATAIAVGCLIYSVVLIGASDYVDNLPEESKTKKRCKKISNAIHDKTPTGNPLKKAFRIVGHELSNPLGFMSCCTLVISAILLHAAATGSTAALFPGLAALFFTIGNRIASSKYLDDLSKKETTHPVIKALLHPAVWYGLGYTATGIGIGGGLGLLSGNAKALALTGIGIAETVGSLGALALGLVKNKAVPFVGVAAGTTTFAVAGAFAGNPLGALVGVFACMGELSLAVIKQKEHNDENSVQTERTSFFGKIFDKIEKDAVRPITFAMERGWIKSSLKTA